MIYSNSRISTFEQCLLKFKFTYIDRVEVESVRLGKIKEKMGMVRSKDEKYR